MRMGPVYLHSLGIINALGQGKQEVLSNLMAGSAPGVVLRENFRVNGEPLPFGEVKADFPPIAPSLSIYGSRNVDLTIAAANEIRADIDEAIDRFGSARVAVVMGTSTSGIAEGEVAVAKSMKNGTLPPDFDIRKQELGSVAEVLARHLGAFGPAYTITTACSSSAQALAVGRRLLMTGLADVVVAGGADSLCQLTVNGFYALSALSAGVCNPFSRNRDGTMMGEGAAVFLMQREESEIALLGAGASSDAHSITAPEPEGAGLILAIDAALDDADISSDEIKYIHLHGTGTQQNDEMESKAIKKIFGGDVPCSSSKAQIGHTLGASGAMGAAHCWLTLSALNEDSFLPPHVWDGEADEGLLSECLVTHGQQLSFPGATRFLCNSTAFGGNNVSLVIARA
jgi:3-oxoacyl-[acyl-carrier-protein] synthase I